MAHEASGSFRADTGQFAATHWSVVLGVAHNDDTRAHLALAELCQTYWYPLYAFIRRHGYSPEDAEDLTQGFFTHLLEHQALASVHPAQGKFRSWLLASLRHFLANERARAQAQKRGGGHPVISLNATSAETRFAAEAVINDSPDKAYERHWALALMEQVLARLSAEQAAAGKGKQFELVRDGLMGDPDAPRYAGLAAQLGVSAEALKMAVCRLRRRYRELLREEIAHTVESPTEVDVEIRHLFAVLAG